VDLRKGGWGMKTCLIVDDSKVIRKVARHILETMKFNVDEAADGQEALAQCAQNAPDVILLDWNMPIMSGMDFLKAYRAGNVSTPAKVIFCTTENGIDHIQAAIAAGADEYVMKPFDRETLEAKLQIVGCA
jgi:two-component system, chemotaxis family, chemotaxis protein CheY